MKNKICDPILEKYNLKVIKTLREPDSGSIRSYVFIVESNEGKRYCLKVFSSSDNEARKRFVDEIYFTRRLSADSPQRYKNMFPTIKWYSVYGENPYYICSYIEGRPLSEFIKDFGIRWGEFKHRNFYYLMDFLYFLNNFNPRKDFEREPRNWGYRTAQRELQYYFENLPGLLPSDLYDKTRSFLERSRSAAFQRKFLSHRDLYPENIMTKGADSTKFTLLDWEYLSYVPVGFDAAFFYLLFWREEYWKAKVFSYYYNKFKAEDKASGSDDLLNQFLASFRFCLVLLGIRFLYQINTFADKADLHYNDAYLSFLYDIRSAVEGHIARPKNIKFFVGLDEVKEVADLYGIHNVKDYTIFYASKGNTVAKVDADGGPYVFRFYSLSRSRSLIEKELTILDELSKAGIKTYSVKHPKRGSLYVEHKLYGVRRKIAVLSFIPGSKIKQQWAGEKAANDVGRTLRQIHDANIIHGDFSKENVLFNRSKVTGVIDFEWGRMTKSKTAKMNDLAKAIALWLIDIRAKKLEEQEFVKEFLKGYYGKIPSEANIKKIKEKIIEKINAEREIFFTTLESKLVGTRRGGRRFIEAIDKLKDLEQSCRD